MTVISWPIVAASIESTTAAAHITPYTTSKTCIGRRLGVMRTSFGVSKRELCGRLGIDLYDLDAFEQGSKRVSANLLLRIAKLFNVQPQYFFQGYTADELNACLESSL
jgi:transcriptional regulator with XRE-family HTH domain